jgi:hypothetical protein
MKALVVVAVLASLAVCSTAAAARKRPVLRTDQVRVVHLLPKEAIHRPFAEAMKERRILELLRSFLSAFRLPRTLTLEVKSCDGKVDAYYDKDTATLCYEYIDLIQRHAPKVGTPGGVARDDAIIGAVVDTILHEAGHAVFDMLQIPVLGREEDAADFFSAYILLRFAPDDARRLIAGVGFMLASEAKAGMSELPNLKTLAGRHGLPAQRRYNILCMAYGADPKTFANVVERGGLPIERAEGCADEYETLQRAMRRLIRPYIDQARLRRARSQMHFNWKPLIKDGLDKPPLTELVTPSPSPR